MTADWENVLSGFLGELAHIRRLSPLTIVAYRRDLQALAGRLPEGPASATPAALRRILASAHGGGLAGRTLARRLAAWRTFYSWLLREGQVSANPARGLRAPRSARRLPGVLSVDAAARLLEHDTVASDGPGAAGAPAADVFDLQDQALFELLYSSGLRLAELIGLDLAQLDLAQGLVTVIGKGQRTRTLPVGTAACKALQAWLAVRPQLAGARPTHAVFLSRRGARLSARTVQARLARRALGQGLPQHVHPHMLRHSCASHVLQSSSDLRAVQELLGHASIASTQIYTHLDFQHLATAYDAAHPRARKPRSGA